MQVENYFNLRDGSVGNYIFSNGRCLKAEYYATRPLVTVRNIIDDANSGALSTYLSGLGLYTADWIGLATYAVLEANGAAGSAYLYVDQTSDEVLALTPFPESPYFFSYDINPTMLFGRNPYSKVQPKAFSLPKCKNVISLSQLAADGLPSGLK